MQRSYRSRFLFFGSIAALASCLLVLFLIGGPALAVPGALDSAFGGDGRVTTDVRGMNSDQGNDVALQSDGKVVVAGYTGSGSTRDFALARYNSNGTPDASFGTDADGAATGTETADFFGTDDGARSVAVQPDGKIVAAGYAYDASGVPAFAVARYDGGDATPGDTTSPRVTRVVPAENATGISPGANVSAFFSEAMTAGSISTSSVKLYKTGSTTALAAAVTYDATTKKATLNPGANLRLGAKYKVVVSAAAKDKAGNNLDQNPTLTGNQPKTWFFTVRN